MNRRFLGIFCVGLFSVLALQLSAGACFAESTETEVLPQQATEAEAVASRKRDLQAAMASLRQSPMPQPDINPWPMVKGLALCLAVFCVVVFLLRKLNPTHTLPGGKRRMRVLEKLAVSQRSALLLIEVDGRVKLVGVGPDSVSELSYQPKMQEFVSAGPVIKPGKEFRDELAKNMESGAPDFNKEVA